MIRQDVAQEPVPARHLDLAFDRGCPLEHGLRIARQPIIRRQRAQIGKRTPNILKYDRSVGSTSTALSDYVTSDDMSIDGVSDFIYRNMIDAKAIPGVIRLGRTVRISKSIFNKFLSEGSAP